MTQSENSLTLKKHGLGLGLYVCDCLQKLHLEVSLLDLLIEPICRFLPLTVCEYGVSVVVLGFLFYLEACSFVIATT